MDCQVIALAAAPQAAASSGPLLSASASAEANRLLYRRQLEGPFAGSTLLPGPLQVAPRGLGGFLVTATSDQHLVGFHHASMGQRALAPAPAAAAASGAGGGVPSSGSGSGSGLLDPTSVSTPSLAAATPAPAPGPAIAMPNWSVNLGEGGVWIGLGSLRAHAAAAATPASAPARAPAALDIVIVGDRSLLALDMTACGAPAATASTATVAAPSAPAPSGLPSGAPAVRQQKRLTDDRPVACALYARPRASNGFLLATESGQLRVYLPDHAAAGGGGGGDAQDYTAYAQGAAAAAAGAWAGLRLAWASKLPFVPVALAVGTFAGQRGLVALLSDAGELAIVAQGTVPPLTSHMAAPALAATAASVAADFAPNQPLDFQSMDAEHRRLMAVIKEVQAGGGDGGGALRLAALVDPLGAASTDAVAPVLAAAKAADAADVLPSAATLHTPGLLAVGGVVPLPAPATPKPADTKPGPGRAEAMGRERVLRGLSFLYEPSDWDSLHAGSEFLPRLPSTPGAAGAPRVIAVKLRVSLAALTAAATTAGAAAAVGKAIGAHARNIHMTVELPAWGGVLLPQRFVSQALPDLVLGDTSAFTFDDMEADEDDASRQQQALASVGAPRLNGGFEVYLPFLVRPRSGGMPADARVRVAVTYSVSTASKASAGAVDAPAKEDSGDSAVNGCAASVYKNRVAVVDFSLPLCLFASICAPVKTAEFKLTIDTNLPSAPPLVDLFPDLVQVLSKQVEQEKEAGSVGGPAAQELQKVQQTGSAIVSMRYHTSQAQASILASKSSGRFRIQAESLEALTFATTELCSRLLLLPGPGGQGMKVSYSEPLPLADVFAAFDEHFSSRKKLLDAFSELNDRSQEYRVVTKRLLVRFKERAPPPLNGLDALVATVQESVTLAAAEVQRQQMALAAAANRLSCVVKLLLLMLRLRYQEVAQVRGAISAVSRALCADVRDSLEHGWEERAEAALGHVLKSIVQGSSSAAGAASGAAASKPGHTGPTAKAVGDSTAVTASEDAAGLGIDGTADLLGDGPSAAAGFRSSAHPLSMPTDTSKLKRYITIVCDRLERLSAAEGGFSPFVAAMGTAMTTPMQL
jgi:hypothetical protein